MPPKGILARARAEKKTKQKLGCQLAAAERKQRQQFEDAAEERNTLIISQARADITKILDQHPDKVLHFLFMLQSEIAMAPKGDNSDQEDPWFINQTTTIAKVPQTWMLSFLPTVEASLDADLLNIAYDCDHSIVHRAACLAFNVEPDFRMRTMKFKPIFRRYMKARYELFGKRLKGLLANWNKDVGKGKYPWERCGVFTLVLAWDGTTTGWKYTTLKHIGGSTVQLKGSYDETWTIKSNWLEKAASLTNADDSESKKCWKLFGASDVDFETQAPVLQATDDEMRDAIVSLRTRSERLPAIRLEKEFESASKKLRIEGPEPCATDGHMASLPLPPPPPPDGTGASTGEAVPLPR